MRIWADVYRDGRRQAQPVPLLSVTITRVLDGAGNFDLEAQLPASETALLTNLSEVALWAEQDGVLAPRLLGRGVVTQIDRTVTPSGTRARVSGPDTLEYLRRKSVLIGLSVAGDFASAAQTLATRGGWVANTVGGWPAPSLRFDGVSLLNALITLVQSAGVHLRLGDLEREIEIGVFGQTINTLVTNARFETHSAAYNPHVLLIKNLTIADAGSDVVTWLLPLGGTNASPVTLENSTRDGIVPLTGPDGVTRYAIQDDAGVAAYGQIEAVKTFDSVTNLGDSVAAANALYDTARAWLTKQAQAKTAYRITVVNIQQTVRPGDLVRLQFDGAVQTISGENRYLNVDGAFYVLSATERISTDHTLDLELSSVDRAVITPAQIVANSIQTSQQTQLKTIIA